LSPLFSTADVTLDPDTANPYLILSEDGKQVSDGDTRQDLPDNPERFNPVVSVLGRQGFTSGRHYWQVEVGEKNAWTLGVARMSISRKGKITLSPKNGYWTVWLRDAKYQALASPSISLPLSVKPWKLGVYLDYDEGQVSFYNANTSSHIYTFTDTFTEKLYPFFSPGINTDGKNAAPLIILPVSDRD
ncbi:E3 ubiquitin-protein ligase TRIM39-like, partial [Polyodon spathula]|uniref:E3 ubiquitin-protein ligase TRIM39-like n=1 Tax=Polyodon spathula TaxID=7913 RepID=UPI001B7DF935